MQVERALVERAQRGEHEAFDAITRASAGRLYALAQLIVGEPQRAEDAMQEALVRGWRDLPSLRDPDRFDAWLDRLLVHACYDELRKRRRWDVTGSLQVSETVASEDHAASVVARDELDRAFRRLSPEHRAVVVLRHYEDLSVPDVADRPGIAVGTVKSRLHHATNALRAALDADARPGPAKGRRIA